VVLHDRDQSAFDWWSVIVAGDYQTSSGIANLPTVVVVVVVVDVVSLHIIVFYSSHCELPLLLAFVW